MPNEGSKLETYADHEQTVAERYKWWGVYLVREKRRLGGIAEAVQAEEVAKVTRMQAAIPGPTLLEGDGEPVETPEDLLTRVDAEPGMADVLAELDEDAEKPGEGGN